MALCVVDELHPRMFDAPHQTFEATSTKFVSPKQGFFFLEGCDLFRSVHIHNLNQQVLPIALFSYR